MRIRGYLAKDYRNAPELVHKYLGYALTIQGKSELTMDEYYLDIRMFLKFIVMAKRKPTVPLEQINETEIEDADILSVTAEDINDFLFYLRYDRKNKAATRCRKTAAIRAFYKYLANNHLIPENPALATEFPTKSRREPIYLSLSESMKLLEFCETDGIFKERNFCILTFFLNCGMRLDELAGIDTDDIRDEEIVITGKGDKQRTLILNETCLAALAEYLPHRIIPKSGPDRNALFTSRQRNRISKRTIQSIVEHAIKCTGLDKKYTTHKLRHTAATLMFQNGTNIKELQELLGHDAISSTSIYAHVSNKQVKEALTNNPLNYKRVNVSIPHKEE